MIFEYLAPNEDLRGHVMPGFEVVPELARLLSTCRPTPAMLHCLERLIAGMECKVHRVNSRYGGAGRSKQRGSRSTAAQKQRRPGTKYRPRKAPPTDRARLKVKQRHLPRVVRGGRADGVATVAYRRRMSH